MLVRFELDYIYPYPDQAAQNVLCKIREQYILQKYFI